VTSGIWKLFESIETVVSPEAKESTSKWLAQLSLEDHFTSWAKIFSGVFDHIFGTRHPSRRCFRRSSIASLIAVLVMTLFWAYLRTEEFMAFIDEDGTVVGILVIFITSVILNLVPDYLSLLESRYVLSRL